MPEVIRKEYVFVDKELIVELLGSIFLRINKGYVYRAQLFGLWFLAGLSNCIAKNRIT